MSFYGDIKRVQSSPFVFDKYYPNRKAMDDGANEDNVYIGRYILIKYTTDGEGNYFNKYTKPDNINTQSVYTGYQKNADIDIATYGDTFDGTVWQKIYTNVTEDGQTTSIQKYIMIAELNAAVPRLELDITSPKYYIENKEEEWRSPEILPEASTEDAYHFLMPNVLHLDVGEMTDDFYAKSLIDPSRKVILKDDQNQAISHEDMLSDKYNYMAWINEEAIEENGKIKYQPIESPEVGQNIDGKKLDTKLYAFGQLISDLYDALYGVPVGGEGQRPFYTNDLTSVLANYDKGLVGILSSIATDLKGDPSNDLYERKLQPGMYYYFTSKWCDASEDPDSFIENIPRVIGSAEEYDEGKSHYMINNLASSLEPLSEPKN